MNKLRPIIFDFDGVIADSELIIGQVMSRTLTEFGLPTTLEESFERYLGRSHADTQKLIEERYGKPMPLEYRETIRSRIGAEVEASLQPVPGVASFLKEITGRRVGIASSSSPDWIISGLNRFGVEHHFGDDVYSAVGLARAKPHPDVYLHAAKLMGIGIEQAIVIEDSFNGVTAGVASGATVIGLTAGSHMLAGSVDQLQAAGANFIAGCYDQVQECIQMIEKE